MLYQSAKVIINIYSKSKTADYHHDMNSVNFMELLKEYLIPN